MSTLFRSLLLQLTLFVSLTSSVFAVSYGDSIDTIPRGSIITIRHELEIPANRDYIMLGSRMHDQIHNSLRQPYNERQRYYGYYDYRNGLFESYEKTYQGCIEIHRRYISTGGGSSNVTVNQRTRVSGQNNTVINNTIINQGASAPYRSYSYIAPNDCIPPEYTLTMLVVDRSGKERLIAEDKQFKVKQVQVMRAGIFNEVFIRFQHKVVKGVVVLTTYDPRSISINALDAATDGGFLSTLHNALLGIAGENLEITLPEAEYID